MMAQVKVVHLSLKYTNGLLLEVHMSKIATLVDINKRW